MYPAVRGRRRNWTPIWIGRETRRGSWGDWQVSPRATITRSGSWLRCFDWGTGGAQRGLPHGVGEGGRRPLSQQWLKARRACNPFCGPRFPPAHVSGVNFFLLLEKIEGRSRTSAPQNSHRALSPLRSMWSSNPNHCNSLYICIHCSYSNVPSPL